MWVLVANHEHRLHTAADLVCQDIPLLVICVLWQIESPKQLTIMLRGKVEQYGLVLTAVVCVLSECMQIKENTLRMCVHQADSCL